MNHPLSRLLATILATLLLCGMFPVFSHAEEGEGEAWVILLRYSLPEDTIEFGYEYNDGKNGNIMAIMEDGVETHRYTYDKIGQLKSDNSTTYDYDIGGNLTHVNGVERFKYENSQWRDQLTAVDSVGLAYDAIGNLTFDGTNTYRWQKARQLTGINSNIQYSYDYNGLRSSKTVDSVRTDFYWAGGLLMAQKSTNGNTIAWSYDGGGKMIGFTFNNVPYFYLRNLQGDVVAILDTHGTIVAEYVYDAWGKVLSAEGPMAEVNPIRYRGYYWDSETGYYYCQSRYYNPQWCRWISADLYMDTGRGILGTNMYAYW